MFADVIFVYSFGHPHIGLPYIAVENKGWTKIVLLN